MRNLFLAAVVGCAGAAFAAPTGWDAKATASLEAEVTGMMKSIDEGKFEAITSKVAPDSVTYDIGPDNKPTALVGADALKAYFASIAEEMKKSPMTMKSSPGKMNCHANAQMGFCAFEFAQEVSSNGKSVGTQKFRGTLVAHKAGKTWVWDHWHGSFAEMPAPPPAPAPAPAPAAAPAAAPAKK